jgi:hypothetical protein
LPERVTIRSNFKLPDEKLAMSSPVARIRSPTAATGLGLGARGAPKPRVQAVGSSQGRKGYYEKASANPERLLTIVFRFVFSVSPFSRTRVFSGRNRAVLTLPGQLWHNLVSKPR